VVLDTLKLARRLAAAGMPTEQADGVAAAIAEGVAEQVATKADLGEIRTEILTLRAELKAQIGELRVELKAEIGEFQTATTTEFARIRTEMAELRTSMIQWIVGAVLLNWAAMAGLVIAIWNLSHR